MELSLKEKVREIVAFDSAFVFFLAVNGKEELDLTQHWEVVWEEVKRKYTEEQLQTMYEVFLEFVKEVQKRIAVVVAAESQEVSNEEDDTGSVV